MPARRINTEGAIRGLGFARALWDNHAMPSRGPALVIILFWLGANGWFFWHDLWPRWKADQPPAPTIDVVDQVQLDRKIQVYWTVRANGRDAYRALTWVERVPGSDLYDLRLELKPLGPRGPDRKVEGGGLFLVEKLDSTCRVTEAGELRALSAEMTVKRSVVRVSVRLDGAVRGGLFHCHYKRETDPPLGNLLAGQGDLEPVPVSYNGAILLPMHPPHRIQGLWPGRTWQVPSLDPERDSAGLRMLGARTLSETEDVPWRGRQVSCFVVEYRNADGDVDTRTWVEREGGLVLRQEAVVGLERWQLQRER